MNTKKLSAPGRRASNRPRAAFKADTDTVVTEINSTDSSSKSSSDDATAAAKALKEQKEQAEQARLQAEREESSRLAKEQAAREEAELQRQKEEERRQAEKAAQEQAALEKEAQEKAERKRLKEEARRLAEERAEAEEQAAYEEQLARDKAERHRLREIARQKAAEEEQEAEERAQREQAARERAEEQRRLEEARLAAEQEEERLAQEQAEAEKAEKKRAKMEARRLAEEELERAEQEAFEKQVAADKAERKRLREEAARQKAAEEEEARRLAEEAAVRRQEEEAAVIAAAQAAAKEELERERLAAEQQLKEEEEARLAEEKKQQEQEAAERARAAAVAQQKEEERLRLVREKAAAERKKRNAFLDDMDSFSSSFEQSQSEKEAARQQAEKESVSMLTGTIASASKSFVPSNNSERSEQQKRSVEEEEAEAQRLHQEKVLAYERQAALDAKEEEEEAARLREKQRQQREEELAEPTEAGPDFQDLTNALFSSKDKKETLPPPPVASKKDLFGDFDDDNEDESAVVSSINSSTTTSAKVSSFQDGADDEVLSMPKIDRIMSVKGKGQKQATAKATEKVVFTATDNELFGAQEDIASGGSKQSEQPEKKVTPRNIVTSDVLGRFSDDEDDDCGEDLTTAQRVEWRAKQEDLNTRRKEFHGAVTYAFGGCFSWQMYSAVDAVDEHGKSYTEYLMRCQWGTNWDNMQPWLVARRFREFDTLNDLLQQHYPNVKSKMHPLPKKQFFGSLDAATVEQRTRDIEAYVCTIVTNIPSLLKSKYIDGFFSIQERITQIRKQIEEEKKKGNGPAPNPSNLFDGVVPLAPGTVEELGHSTKDGTPTPVVKETTKTERLTPEDLLTVEEVEARCGEELRGFDDDELGQAEERIRDFRYRLTKTPTKYLTKDAKVRRLLTECQALWPRLHVSCRIGSEVVDPMLIARSMQAEEELESAVRELRSFLAAQSMGSPLHC